ncbi:hypothetical protein MKW98_027419 [Papaver atlanticum]|uniref:Transmembrane protein n=1 Tax=Papaver atlanticum TaxID=357466 RepID=A0AAD4THB4_9MAGN|nr:hypothetical protein MKW98_027419 [Papaver atlanticum]
MKMDSSSSMEIVMAFIFFLLLVGHFSAEAKDNSILLECCKSLSIWSRKIKK